MKETIAASSGIFGMHTPGAFSRALAALRPDGVVGTITDGTPAPVSGAVTAGVSAPVAVPAFSVRKRINVVSALGQPPFGQAATWHPTVREQYNYTTRVIANGDVPGPHPRSAPV